MDKSVEFELVKKVKECKRLQKKYDIVKAIMEHNDKTFADCRAYKDSIILIQQEEIVNLKTKLFIVEKKKGKKKKRSKLNCLRKSNDVGEEQTHVGAEISSYYEELKRKELEITEAQQTIRDMKLDEIEMQFKLKELEEYQEQLILDQSNNITQIESQKFDLMANIEIKNKTILDHVKLTLRKTEEDKKCSIAQSKTAYDELEGRFHGYKSKVSCVLADQDQTIDDLEVKIASYNDVEKRFNNYIEDTIGEIKQLKQANEQLLRGVKTSTSNQSCHALPSGGDNKIKSHQDEEIKRSVCQMEEIGSMTSNTENEYQQKISHLEKQLQMSNESKAILSRKLREHRNKDAKEKQ